MFEQVDYTWTGYWCYYGMTDASSLPASAVPADEGHTRLHQSTNGQVYYLDTKTAKDKVYWLIYEYIPDCPDRANLDCEQLRDKLRAKLSSSWLDKNETLQAYVEHASSIVQTGQWIPPDEYLTESWHSGRCVLVGDSAHKVLPFTGMGCNMALHDAMVLALCITDNPDQHTAAFQKYHARRFSYSQAERAKAKSVGNVQLTQSCMARYARNLAFQTFGSCLTRKAYPTKKEMEEHKILTEEFRNAPSK
jgi:2-polyprenyl-6-methoxyphenol hydroxylase-like FAD-dependent oxidoreductase